MATPSRPMVRVRTMSMRPSRSNREGKQSLGARADSLSRSCGGGSGRGPCRARLLQDQPPPLQLSPASREREQIAPFHPAALSCQTDGDFSGAWRDGGAGGFQTRADRAGAAVSCGRAREKPKLPPLADKARRSRSDQASGRRRRGVGAAFWLSYLFSMFYIAIAAETVTHTDLLLENPGQTAVPQSRSAA